MNALRVVILLLLVPLFAVLSLYAYRSQAPGGEQWVAPGLAVVPFVLLIVLIILAARAFTRGVERSSAPRRIEALARLAELRDRGVVSEEEFQREKRRFLE